MVTISFEKREIDFIADAIANFKTLSPAYAYTGVGILKKFLKSTRKSVERIKFQSALEDFISKNKIPSLTPRKKK